jgi:hypothetical protein
MNIINSNMRKRNSLHANLKILGVKISRLEGLNAVTVNLFVL